MYMYERGVVADALCVHVCTYICMCMYMYMYVRVGHVTVALYRSHAEPVSVYACVHVYMYVYVYVSRCTAVTPSQ